MRNKLEYISTVDVRLKFADTINKVKYGTETILTRRGKSLLKITSLYNPKDIKSEKRNNICIVTTQIRKNFSEIVNTVAYGNVDVIVICRRKPVARFTAI